MGGSRVASLRDPPEGRLPGPAMTLNVMKQSSPNAL